MEHKNKLKGIWLCLFLLLAPLTMSQKACLEATQIGPGEDFRLTIEPAWITYGQPNISQKSELEKKLFPDRNSIVEFFFNDPLHCVQGFRIDTISTNNYVMEVAWVTNIKGEDTFQKIEIPMNTAFVDHLWKTYYHTMREYQYREIAPDLPDDYSVTFRCVVEDFSVWTFFVRNPHSHMKYLAMACNDIVREAQENGKIIDEKKYIKQLDDILREGIRGGAKMPGLEIELDSMQLIRFGE